MKIINPKDGKNSQKENGNKHHHNSFYAGQRI
jgi:hypothetical protein